MSSEARGVKMAFSPDHITIASDNPDLGEVREDVDAQFNGEAAGRSASTRST
jgi:DNA polymerase III sliding clamp (beta) subunit (PCNA family)